MSTKSKSQAGCRFRMWYQGILRVHIISRKNKYLVYPGQIKKVDENGVSIVIKEFYKRLNTEDLLRLLKKLEELGLRGQPEYDAKKTKMFIDEKLAFEGLFS